MTTAPNPDEITEILAWYQRELDDALTHIDSNFDRVFDRYIELTQMTTTEIIDAYREEEDFARRYAEAYADDFVDAAFEREYAERYGYPIETEYLEPATGRTGNAPIASDNSDDLEF